MEVLFSRAVNRHSPELKRRDFTRPTLASGLRMMLWLAACVPVLSLMAAGCTTTNSFLSVNETLGAAPSGSPCRVAAAWIPQVTWTEDPTRNGAPTPGIAGRIYLFGEDMKLPLTAEGAIVVDLFDETPGRPKASAPIEEWRFDKDTLKRLQRKDPVGWGYTLFLPWGSYKPDTTQVQLRVRFEPPKGYPLYASSAPLTFKNKLEIKSQTVQRVVKPSEQQPIQQTSATEKR
jgi:hypothetical protein